MRYRMEVIEDELIIRNVDMDIRLGTAVPIYFEDPRSSPALDYSSLHRLKQRWRGDRHSTFDCPEPAERGGCGDCELRGVLRLSRVQGWG